MKLHTLENGAQVIFEERKNTDNVFISVTVNVGSNHETEKENGIAHFLEHMCFAGTERFPKREDLIISICEIDAHPGPGAFTNKTNTWYNFFGEKSKFKDMTTFLADIFLNPIFKKEEVENEKYTVIKEMQKHKNKPHSIFYDELDKNEFKDTPAERPIIGTEKTVNEITSEGLSSFHKKHYNAKNTIITIVGNVNEEEALSTVGGLFNKMPIGDKSKQIIFTKEQIGTDKKHTSILREQDNQMQLLINFPFPTLNAEDHWIAEILSKIISMDFSSRLFSSNPGIGVSRLVIGAEIDSNRVEEATQFIKKKLDLIKANGVTEYEIEIAKNKIISEFVGDESNKKIAQLYIKDIIDGRAIQTYEDKIKEIKKVTPEKVAMIANKLLKNDNVSVVYMGNKIIPEHVSQCLRETSSKKDNKDTIFTFPKVELSLKEKMLEKMLEKMRKDSRNNKYFFENVGGLCSENKTDSRNGS